MSHENHVLRIPTSTVTLHVEPSPSIADAAIGGVEWSPPTALPLFDDRPIVTSPDSTHCAREVVSAELSGAVWVWETRFTPETFPETHSRA